MSKEPLLFLCHRIPFPPNKGDKIRSFNILKQLIEHFDVYLGCFIDDPFDKRYTDELSGYCKALFTLDQNKNVAKVKGLTSFLTGKPITLPYYFDRRMQTWVDDVLARHNIQNVFVYSSSMAQYCQASQYQQLNRIIDFVDVDSDKWRQYAEKKSGIAKWVFNREYELLGQCEDEICQVFDYSLFVSPDEAALFEQRQAAQNKGKVLGILNGVDVDYFNPTATFLTETLIPDAPFISFTGAMDYWANVDAVVWFVDVVWPLIIKKIPTAKFVIAGGNPTSEVKSLANEPGVIVTGRVADVRPFIAQAACVVAPLRIARGIQNKVLEAMSLNKPIVCTPMAMEGINAAKSKHVHIEDAPVQTAQACIEYLQHASVEDCANREWILEHFTWHKTLKSLPHLFNKEAAQ